MSSVLTDDELCLLLTDVLSGILPDLLIQGGADEPFYEAAKEDQKAVLYFRDNF